MICLSLVGKRWFYNWVAIGVSGLWFGVGLGDRIGIGVPVVAGLTLGLSIRGWDRRRNKERPRDKGRGEAEAMIVSTQGNHEEADTYIRRKT